MIFAIDTQRARSAAAQSGFIEAAASQLRAGVLFALSALWLAGCGGGSDEPTAPRLTTSAAAERQLDRAADPATSQSSSSDSLTASESRPLVTADMTLDWAEYRYRELFATPTQLFPAVDYQGQTYNARLYAGSWGERYLGVTPDGRVFGLGDFTQDQLQQFETLDHWAPQVLQDWCAVRPLDCSGAAVGYGGGTPVPPATTAIDHAEESVNGAPLAVALVDGSRVAIGTQAAAFAAQLEREAGIDEDIRAAIALRPGLQSSGSVRGLYVIGSKDVTTLKPTLTVPAQDAVGLNPDTLMAMRLGPVVVNGVMDFEHVSLLPVSRDAQGQLSFVDPLFRDGLVTNADIAQAPARARALQARRRDSSVGYEWVGGARYVLTSFQNDLNWSSEPALVRMVPDTALSAKGWRRPATSAELVTLAKQPICNLVLLVHGHNEEEKAGNAQTTAEAPWNYSYKKLVWDLLYQTALATDINDRALYPSACTAFYEFIYPSYRAIYSPVSSKGGGVQETLGEALGRLVGEELKRNAQLAAMLANGMPLNTVVVGHSQGGLVARAGLRFMPEKFKAQVKRLVTWGSPHHGAALVSMRYAMHAGHDLVIDGYRLPLQNLVQSRISALQLDTPGTRDLRLETKHSSRLNLRAMFPSLDAAAEAGLAPTMFSSNLAEFNAIVGSREIEPGPAYTMLTGSTQRWASFEIEDATGGWWLQFRGQQVAKFTSSTAIEKGAALNRVLLKSGYQANDGAAPLFSQQAAAIYGPEAVDMGDINHEEFYGSEPAQRTSASLSKGRFTAERTLERGRLNAPTSACPSIQSLRLTQGLDTMTVTGSAYFPSLSASPAKAGALIQRVEARANSAQGNLISALSFQFDSNGQFSATANATAVPAGTFAVVVMLKDGSQLLGTLEQAAPSDFDQVRIFDQPWVVTENREGLMRAIYSRNYNGAALQCDMTLSWTLPSSHSEPLQIRIVRLLKRDGVTQNETFFLNLLSYLGRRLPLGDGRYASRTIETVSPPSVRTNTAAGNQLDLNYLPPNLQSLSTEYYTVRPTLYIEVKGLCGAAESTQIRFDYKP